MQIFEHIIANDIIKGITALKTDHNEGLQTISYSFNLIVANGIPVPFSSDTYSLSDKGLREQWLAEYQHTKEWIAKMLGEKSVSHASHNSLVHDCCTDINAALDAVLKYTAPISDDAAVMSNNCIERVHVNLKKLSDLALR